MAEEEDENKRKRPQERPRGQKSIVSQSIVEQMQPHKKQIFKV